MNEIISEIRAAEKSGFAYVKTPGSDSVNCQPLDPSSPDIVDANQIFCLATAPESNNRQLQANVDHGVFELNRSSSDQPGSL